MKRNRLPWIPALFCIGLTASPGAAGAPSPDGLPRGLIVHVGGAAPEPGPGRVTHHLATPPARLPYAGNTVRHLVCEAPVSRAEILRVLRPLGTARLKIPSGWREIVKPWPDDIDDWTHWLYGPGGNPVSADRRAGIPRRLLWTATPRRARSHEKSPSLTGMVGARGRLFYICDEAPVSVGGKVPDRWRLVARDAFSGALLWKQDVPDWGWQAWSPTQPMNLRWGNPRFIHRRLVAAGDRVFVTLGYSAPVSVLDAETGRAIRVLRGTEGTAEILFHDDTLVLSVATQAKDSVKSSPPHKVVAVNPDTGKILWETGPMASQEDFKARGKAALLKQGRLMIAADGDFVIAASPSKLVCLDLETGRTRWEADAKSQDAMGSLTAYRGHVYYGRVSKKGIVCYDGATGRERWSVPGSDWTYSTAMNFYLLEDRLVTRNPAKNRKAELLFIDLETGKETRRVDVSAINSQHHHRCYRNKATRHFLFMGKEGVECVDFRTGTVTVNRWVRGACLYGIMPANGLLYFTPEACACNLMNRLDGYGALAPAASAPAPEHPFHKGPAFGKTAEGAAVDTAWPQYRRGILRSAATAVDPAPGPGWQVALGGLLTAPTSDNVRLYLGRDDEVLALDCRDGRIAWRAPGRIDSPPSLHRGLAIYGTRDGWVHGRLAGTGEPVWRFRAAPEERLILDDDRIESVWPVHGSVLIFRDTVYVSAGRSSNLDGGLRLFALDPATGTVRASSTFFTEQTVQADYYEGVNNDLLTTDGGRIFLKHMRIDPETLAVTRQRWWDFSGPDGKLKNYPKDPVKLPVEDTRTRELASSAGFLDEELFGRAHMQLDRAELCNRICFDAERSYGIRHSIGSGHFQFYTPGSRGFPVLCFDRTKQAQEPPKGLKPHEDADPMPDVKGSKLRGKPPVDHGVVWHRRIAIRPTALIAAGRHLVIGGGPDRLDPDDPLKSPEWLAGGLVCLLDRTRGETIRTIELPAPPVHEGVIAVPAGLFACLKDGSLVRIEMSGK
jgi:outer membrane protein assembly factor BamB